MNSRNSKLGWESVKISLIFLFARFVMLLSIPLEGLKSYGDYWNYYELAAAGTPFLEYWVEFPPLFPFIFRGIYLAVAGREHAFIYSFIILFSIVQAANLYLFQKLAILVLGESEAAKRTLTYGFILINLFYGWAYFDCLAVFSLLLGLNMLLNNKALAAGSLFGIGGLIKWFPVLAIPAAWKWKGPKAALQILFITAAIIVIVWGLLAVVSPENTNASIIAQGKKGSWETIWAIIDGNLHTGNFGLDIDRFIPETASQPTGNPATISPWLTLVLMGGIGLYVFLRSNLESVKDVIAFVTLTFVLFFLWSPGYSPQWSLYLFPLVLLSFDYQRGILFSITILMVNLLEWPILLSRGWFYLIEEIILIRSAIYILLAVVLIQYLLRQRNSKGNENLGQS